MCISALVSVTELVHVQIQGSDDVRAHWLFREVRHNAAGRPHTNP